ncbi:MAG: DNA repair protein RecO [Candidatus Doudnabacteria bacterium]|nr:DNA repair protein RecO [Candidatus Doudnabacteria bacterium]
MKYKKLTGIILKKQNYKEADQILTLWTREAGKVRVLAKSIRLPKSKLIYNLNELASIDMEVVGHKNLPVVISAVCRSRFKNFHTDLIKMGSAFYAAELVTKITADEHPNLEIYDLLLDFFQNLNDTTSLDHYQIIDEFALKLTSALGFGRPEVVRSHLDVRSFIEELLERNLKSETLLNQII